MELSFYKYQGTGNDFIIIDNRNDICSDINSSVIGKLCDRRFGIGADGLILLGESEDSDFKMTYYNSDGNESTMCGNGGRCIVAFALKAGIVKNKFLFTAIDGKHEAAIINDTTQEVNVKLKMKDVSRIDIFDTFSVLDTGSPHYVAFVKNIDVYDVYNQGKSIRYNEMFGINGINVNFIERYNDYISIRTYERGVENETLSCGTGAVASALTVALIDNLQNHCISKVRTPGGFLNIHFKRIAEHSFTDIWLEGPATFVFKGKIKI